MPPRPAIPSRRSASLLIERGEIDRGDDFDADRSAIGLTLIRRRPTRFSGTTAPTSSSARPSRRSGAWSGRSGEGAAGRRPLARGRSADPHLRLPFLHLSESLTHLDGGKPFRRLMLALDTGSAIVGPARGDIFTGSGDDAGELAGTVRNDADFYHFGSEGRGGRDSADGFRRQTKNEAQHGRPHPLGQGRAHHPALAGAHGRY